MNIKTLQLFTKNLEEQKVFYTQRLGLKLLAENEISFSIEIGRSVLSFKYRSEATPYHFAINIPCNQISEALEWLSYKAEPLPYNQQIIIDFNDWNAKALYFYDADRNIVELIARKNLNNNSSSPFVSTSLLEISEIGLTGTSVEKQYLFLNKNYGLNIYDGDLETFCAIGDEHGLFICINHQQKTWFPLNEKAWPSEFNATIETDGITFQLNSKNVG